MGGKIQQQSDRGPERWIWSFSWSRYCSLKRHQKLSQRKGGCQEAFIKKGKQGEKANIWQIIQELVCWSDESKFEMSALNHHQYVQGRSRIINVYRHLYSTVEWSWFVVAFKPVLLEVSPKWWNYELIKIQSDFHLSCNSVLKDLTRPSFIFQQDSDPQIPANAVKTDR